MLFREYMSDRVWDIFLNFFSSVVILGLMFCFSVRNELIILTASVLVISNVLRFFFDYKRRAKFYYELQNNVAGLDKAYLVLETMNAPTFFDGKIMWDELYKIDKSMAENVQKYEIESNSFREYIELWVHEIKLPLASLTLNIHNREKTFNDDNPKIKKELTKLNDHVEQVLYYARSENAQKDYHIVKIPVGKIIHETMMEHKDRILESGSELNVNMKDPSTEILTDGKWLNFILGQLIANSIKYMKPEGEGRISIRTEDKEASVVIEVEDNGIGITTSDLPRIFEKSFTGSNGIGKAKSTGMGLYIAKELCDKLGHRITAESKEGGPTKMRLEIPKVTEL